MSANKDEWIFVSRGNKSNRMPHMSKAGSARYSQYQQNGEHTETINIAFENSRRTRIKDGARLLEFNEKERVEVAILECFDALKRQYQSNQGFTHRLSAAIATATSSLTENQKNQLINENFHSNLNLNQIVAYGIGNFAKKIHSASMLQLACLLLIRRLAASSEVCNGVKDCKGVLSSFDHQRTTANLFQCDQQRVPIFYFEPCISIFEKQILEETFHIHVLESNNKGKLSIECMRQQWKELNSYTDAMALYDSRHTLFYMPHCPMRLYCNVLWSHWDDIVSSPTLAALHRLNLNEYPLDFSTIMSNNFLEEKSTVKSKILFFGNSFLSYEERAISSEHLLDPTNGIFKLLPFTKEISVYMSHENRNTDDSMRRLEEAFNDCNVITFASLSGPWPDRPKEFSSNENVELGELL